MEQTRIQLNESAYVQAKRISALLAVAFAILCCVLLFTFVLTGFLVADSGMEPALMKGESLYLSRISPYLRGVKRGDIVAYQKGDTLALARVIGLPGEEVEVFEGSVFINGILLDETSYATGALQEGEAFELGKGFFAIAPDVRDGVGLAKVEIGDIVGRVVMRVMPINRLAVY